MSLFSRLSRDQNEMMAGRVEQKNTRQCPFYTMIIPLFTRTFATFQLTALKIQGNEAAV